MIWDNQGSSSDDSDNFNATYGANAPAARAIVVQALGMWGQVLDVIETLGGPVTTLELEVDAADLGGSGRGVTDADGDITMDDDGGGAGWYFDPQPGDSTEFTNIINPFMATGGPAGADFFRTIVHELGHALGINSSDMEFVAPILTGAQINGVGTDQVDNTSSLSLLTPANEPNLITFTDAGGLHIYEGPPDPNFPGAPVQANDLMNSGRTVGSNTRQLISELDVQIMFKAYGDTTTKPSFLPNFSFFSQLNLSTGVLTINGDLNPASPNDQVELSQFNNSLVVKGSAYSVLFPLSSINQIVVQPGAFVTDGNDSITIDLSAGNWIPSLGITVNGGTGNNALNVKGAASDDLYVLSGANITIGTGNNLGLISYSNITDIKLMADPNSSNNNMVVNGTGGVQTLEVVGSDGADTITVFDTSSPLQNLKIDALDGPDLVTIEDLGNNTALEIDPGGGNDVIQFTPTGGNLNVLPSAAPMKINPSIGDDLLLLQDFNTSSITTFGFDVDFSMFPGGEGVINRNLGQFFRHKVEQVILNAGSADDNFLIAGTPVDSDLTIFANDGNDDFFVRSGPPPAVVQDIHSLVAIHGGAGMNTATVDDTADGTGDLLTVTETTVGAGVNDTFFGLGGKLEYHELSDLTINTSSGSDTINVESTAQGTDTTINAGRGNDTITVAGPPDPGKGKGKSKSKDKGKGRGPRKGTADEIKSLLTINGQVGADTLTVIDNSDTTADTMTLTDMTIGMGPTDTILGSASAGIVYTSITTLSILMGSGGNQAFIQSTHPDTDEVFVKTGDGNDTLLVQNLAGTANDIRSKLDIDGQDGQDVATVDDAAETVASTLAVTPDQVLGNGTYFGSGGELTYTDWEELVVNAGLAGDTVTVTGTNPVTPSSPGTVTTLNTGDGTDLVTVGFLGTVDFVRSPLVIHGGPVPSAVVALLDLADLTPDEFTITDTHVGAAAGDKFFGPFGHLQYSNVKQLNVAAGLGDNVINLQSTNPATQYRIGGGGGDDSFVIDSDGPSNPGGTVDLISSPVQLFGGPGTNLLIFDDRSDTTADSVSVTPNGFLMGEIGKGPSDSFFGPGGGVEYDQIHAVVLRMGDTAADTINVTPDSAGGTTFGIDGNDPAAASGVVPGDRLNFDLTGVTSPVVTVLGFGAGVLTSSSHAPIGYLDIEIIDTLSPAFDLVLQMNSPALPGNDALDDDIRARRGQLPDGERTLELEVNGALAFVGVETAVNSLVVNGSSDADTLSIIETVDGLPGFPGDLSAGPGHTNAAFSGSGRTPQAVGIHFDGGTGLSVDRLGVILISPQNVGKFDDLVGPLHSGVVNIDGFLTMSYVNLEPVLLQGAGGSLLIDATLLRDMTEMTLRNLGGDTFEVSGDGGFETTTFSGFDRFVVRPPDRVSLRMIPGLDGDDGFRSVAGLGTSARIGGFFFSLSRVVSGETSSPRVAEDLRQNLRHEPRSRDDTLDVDDQELSRSRDPLHTEDLDQLFADFRESLEDEMFAGIMSFE